MACYTITSRVSKKQKFVDGIINTFGLEVDFEDEDDDEDDSKRSDSRRDNPHHHTDTNKQFIKAILVMKRVRDDGVPGVILCGGGGGGGHDYLCIGSVGAAYNLPALQELRITHILCMADICKAKFPEHFVYKKITCRDTLGRCKLKCV
jgi:hypothetical protein